MFNLRAVVREYSLLGYDTLPLLPGSKVASCRGWQNQDSTQLWQDAPQDTNIGLRAGGEVEAAFLDCDEKHQAGTFQRAQAWLATLGYLPGDYPVIRTPSGGCHIYVSFSGGIPGAYRKLSKDFGAGEFRYGSGAYVAAPPSLIENVAYTLVEGDYRQLPKVTSADVLPLLQNRDLSPQSVNPTIPRGAMALLNWKGVGRYQSRSEAEQACILSLINAGHDFESMKALFDSYPCAGKYAEFSRESPKKALRYLRISYDNAFEYSQTHESPARQSAQAAVAWAESIPWPGKTGRYDRAVFIAHCQIANNAGRLTYSASCRTLAELAGVSSEAATSGTDRLRNAGLIVLLKPSTVNRPTIYQLVPNSYTSTIPPCEEVSNFGTLNRSTT